jgi:hypothetical protein
VECFFERIKGILFLNIKVILMKSILFIAFLALATIGCDTPDHSTGSGSDTTSPPMSTDTSNTMSQPSGTGSDTSANMPMDTTTTPSTNPTDTTTRQ